MIFPHGGAADIWRDLEQGQIHNPEKYQIRDWGKRLELLTSSNNVTTSDWINGQAYAELPDWIVTNGYSVPGDLGAALWHKKSAQPNHLGKRQFTNGIEQAWYELVVPIVYPEMLGADRTGVSLSTTAFAQAFSYAIAKDITGRSSGVYKIDGSIAPGARWVWDWGNTRLKPDITTPANYNEMMHYPLSAPVPGTAVGMGVYCVFDCSGGTGSINHGWLSILGANTENSMRMEKRLLIPEDMVAISATTKSSDRIKWDILSIQDFGHGLLQGDMREAAVKIHPYTRWNFRELEIVRCLVPLQSGQSGRGFDDILAQQLKISRSSGRSIIRGTGFEANNFFFIGLDEQDFEPQTMSLVAGSLSAELSADSAHVVVGKRLAFEKGGLGKSDDTPGFAQTSIGFAATVVSKNGLTVTFDRAPEESHADLNFVITDASILIESANVNVVLFYTERLVAEGVEVGFKGHLNLMGFKPSGGPLASLYDSPIVITSPEEASVTFQTHDVGINSETVKSIVAVGSQRNGSEYSQATVSIGMAGARGKADLYSDPLRVVELRGSNIAGGYVDASFDSNPELNLSAKFSSGLVQYTPFKDGPQYLVGGTIGKMATKLIAEISTALASGGFSAVANDSSAKTPGTSGSLRHSYNGTAGELIGVTTSVSGHVLGALELRFQNGSTLVGSTRILARGNGRNSTIVECPAGVIDRIAIFAFATEEYTLDEFTIERVLSV
ncbi:MAG: hypothetical protein ABJL99_10175 [Aliishimia sp.]